MINSIKIGTRSSNLAMYQANLVKEKLTEIFPNIKYSIVKIKTKGDKIQDQNLEVFLHSAPLLIRSAALRF